MDEWAQLLSVLEEAARFGKSSYKDGAVAWGWREPPSGKPALDASYRYAWLRHLTFPPLMERELVRLQDQRGRPLPEPLAAFYRCCSNGLDLFSGGLAVFGVQKHRRRDPEYAQPFNLVLEAIETEAAHDGWDVFGSREEHEETLAFEADGRTVVAFTADNKRVSEWDSFWHLLLDEAERLKLNFDDEGRRLPYADLLYEL